MENSSNIQRKITLPIIVEGRYDKSVISSFFDATVITTGGFSVFNSKEKDSIWIIDTIRDSLTHGHFYIDFDSEKRQEIIEKTAPATVRFLLL